LQPAEEDLGGTRICHCALAKTTLDLGVARGLMLSARGTPWLSAEKRLIVRGGAHTLEREGLEVMHMTTPA
jgi:hypothetical protein